MMSMSGGQIHEEGHSLQKRYSSVLVNGTRYQWFYYCKCRARNTEYGYGEARIVKQMHRNHLRVVRAAREKAGGKRPKKPSTRWRKMW